MGEDWDGVLRQFLPRIVLSTDRQSYQREMIGLIARIHDTHANLWSGLDARPPEGPCRIPVITRYLGGEFVVTGYTTEPGQAAELQVGDVITEIGKVSVHKLVKRWLPYYAGSNDASRYRDMAKSLSRGVCGAAAIRVVRERRTLDLNVQRVPLPGQNLSGDAQHDRPGETFQLLSERVGYLKLSSVDAQKSAEYIDRARQTVGLIVDIRNYPASFVAFTLATLLVERPTEFARFTRVDLSNPGALYWTPPVTLHPAQPHYTGPVAILVDEDSQSQSEYTAMALRGARRAIVIGSTTAGADGNVSPIPLPGGLGAAISGLGVFYADKRPTQRVGIVPDIVVRPSVAGIRAGRDEVLERAVKELTAGAP